MVRSLARLLLLSAPLWFVAACGEPDARHERAAGGDMSGRAQSGSAALLRALPMDEMARGMLPAGSVRVGDDLFLVPLPSRDGACQGYRLHSETRMVLQALYFRRADGAFTISKSDACG